jgi:hypothetical protein
MKTVRTALKSPMAGVVDDSGSAVWRERRGSERFLSQKSELLDTYSTEPLINKKIRQTIGKFNLPS